MRIQELLAKIGGFFNAILIVSQLLITNYVDYNYYTSIYQYFKNYENEKRNSKVKDNSKIDIIVNRISKVRNGNTDNIDSVNINKSNINESNVNKLIDSNVNVNDNKYNALNLLSLNNNKDKENSKIGKLSSSNAGLNVVNNSRHVEVDYTKNNNLHISNGFSIEKNILDKNDNEDQTNDDTNTSYFKFVLDTIFCGKSNAVKYQIKSVKLILSFNNIIGISLDNYVKRLSITES